MPQDQKSRSKGGHEGDIPPRGVRNHDVGSALPLCHDLIQGTESPGLVGAHSQDHMPVQPYRFAGDLPAPGDLRDAVRPVVARKVIIVIALHDQDPRHPACLGQELVERYHMKSPPDSVVCPRLPVPVFQCDEMAFKRREERPFAGLGTRAGPVGILPPQGLTLPPKGRDLLVGRSPKCCGPIRDEITTQNGNVWPVSLQELGLGVPVIGIGDGQYPH
jgi:hypothetical protein